MPRKRVARRGRVGEASPAVIAQGTFAFNATSIVVGAVSGAAPFSPESEQGDPVTFIITNSGSGQFAGPTFSDNAAWLTTSASTAGDGTITLTPTIDPLVLSAGSYTGTIMVTDANASNSGATVTVALTVSAADPTIAVTPASLSLSLADETAGSASSVTIFNSGSASLVTPTVGTITYSGVFQNWVSATNIVTNGDGTFTLEITPTAVGGTVGGPYTATIPILSTGATNTPFDYTATLTVTSAASALLTLDRSLDDARADIGGANPEDKLVGVRSANSTPLSGPAVGTITYSGTHGGWCSASIGGVSGTTLTASIDINGLLTEGNSTATIPVTDPNAGNSANYQVFLRLGATAAPATMIVAPTAISRTVLEGDALSSSLISVSNAGAGGDPALGTITAAFTPTVAWGSASVSGTDVTITFDTAALADATYNGTLRISASGATNSPVDVPVQVVVTPVAATFVAPAYTLPSFITHDTNDDSLDGTPFAKPALGSFA